MKKLLSLFLALTLAATICALSAGCGEQLDDQAKLDQTGVIKVGMECNYVPFNWTQTDDSNGAVRYANGLYGNGYDVMVAKTIAEKLGVKLEIVVCTWDGLIEDLKHGNIDMIIAGMSPTAERKRQIDFSDEYYNSNLVIVCKSNSQIANATTLAEVDNAAYTLAAQKDTFHLKALQEQTSNCRTEVKDDFAVMQTDLALGAIDGYVAELPTALTICLDSQYTYVPLENNSTGFTASKEDTAVAVGLRKNSNILEKVNQALAEITAEMRTQFMQDAIDWQSAATELE